LFFQGTPTFFVAGFSKDWLVFQDWVLSVLGFSVLGLSGFGLSGLVFSGLVFFRIGSFRVGFSG